MPNRLFSKNVPRTGKLGENMKITNKWDHGTRVYEVRGYLGKFTDSLGKTRTKTFHRSGYSSSKAAKLGFERAKNEFEEHKEHFAEIQKKPKFDEVYQIWLRTYRLGFKESTLNRVLGIFKHHIIPTLGRYQIDTIDWEQCQSAVLKWRKQVKQFNKLAQYAALVFKTAQKMGVTDTNPMALVDVPSLPKALNTKRNYWTATELKLFLQHLNDVDLNSSTERYDRLAFFYLSATTGLRKGEILALSWADIDLVNSTVTINKTMSRTLDNRQMISTPKTQNSYRTLNIEPDTLQMIKTYRKHLTAIPQANEPMFLNSKGTRLSLMTPNHWLDMLIKETDLPHITVHGLRHTFASIQAANNINVKALQMQLGHSDIKITLNIYAHLSQQELSAKVMDVGKIISL